MARALKAELGWTHPETEEDYRVTVSYVPGSPGSRWEPPEGPEIEILSVREDCLNGAERPDLIPVVEAELSGPWGDRACEEVEDFERAAYEDAREAAREAREDR